MTLSSASKPSPTHVNTDQERDYQRNYQEEQLKLTRQGLELQRQGVNKKGGKVICTRYHELGFMPDDIFAADQAFGRRMCAENPALMFWYWSWAVPFVKRCMHGETLASQLVIVMCWPLCRSWAKEMARQQAGIGRGSLLGKLMMCGVKKLFESACRIHKVANV